jgi:hypothetical protein
MQVAVPCPGEHTFALEIDEAACLASASTKVEPGRLVGVRCPVCMRMLSLPVPMPAALESGDVLEDTTTLLGGVLADLPPSPY